MGDHALPRFSAASSAASSAAAPPLHHHLLHSLNGPPFSSLHLHPCSSAPNGMLLTMNCNSNVDLSASDMATSSSSTQGETIICSTRSGSFMRDAAPAAAPASSLMRYHSAPTATLSSAMAEPEVPIISNFLSQGRSSYHDHYSNPRSDRQQQKQQGRFFSRAADIGALHQDLSEPHSNLCSSETLDRNDAESSRAVISAAAAATSRFGADHGNYRHRSLASALQSNNSMVVEEMEHGMAVSDHLHQQPHAPAVCRSMDFHLPVRMTRSGHGHGHGHGLQHSLQQEANNGESGSMGHGGGSSSSQTSGAAGKTSLLRHESASAGFLSQGMSIEQGASSGNSSEDGEGGAPAPLQLQQHYNFAGFSHWDQQDMAPSSSASNNNMNNENYRKRLRDGDGFYSPAQTESQNGSALEQGGLVNHHFTLGTSTSPEDIYFTDRLSADTVPCRVRAKRGCATHPRSIAERVRRTKISERMKKLQELVPNMDKQTNIAEMLDEAVEYVKGLQREVQKLTEAQAKCRCSCTKSQERD